MEQNLEDLLEIFERDDYEEILNNRINHVTRVNNSLLLGNLIDMRGFVESEIDEGELDEGELDESEIDESEIDEGEIDEGEIDEGEIDINDIIIRALDNIVINQPVSIPENTNEPLSIDSMNTLNIFRVWHSYEGTCGVCLENFKWLDNLVELPCKHTYHSGCIMRWFETKCTCPTCRFKLNSGESNDGLINDILGLTRLTVNLLEYGARNLL